MFKEIEINYDNYEINEHILLIDEILLSKNNEEYKYKCKLKTPYDNNNNVCEYNDCWPMLLIKDYDYYIKDDFIYKINSNKFYIDTTDYKVLYNEKS